MGDKNILTNKWKKTTTWKYLADGQNVMIIYGRSFRKGPQHHIWKLSLKLHLEDVLENQLDKGQGKELADKEPVLFPTFILYAPS